MVELKLWLAGESRCLTGGEDIPPGTCSPELERIELTHPLFPGKRTLVRGKTSGAVPGGYSFQWSPAVRALTLFLLRTRALAPEHLFQFAGDAGSPAASLDYAIGKKPVWLQELFGWDDSGVSQVLRFIRRTNPERKCAGPVILALNSAMIPAERIVVFYNNEPVENAAAFMGMADLIENASRSSPAKLKYLAPKVMLREPSRYAQVRTDFLKTQSELRPRPFEDPKIHYSLRTLFKQEISRTLREVDIFRTGEQNRLVTEIAKHPSFAKLVNGSVARLAPLRTPLPAAARLGIVHPSARATGLPLRVATCPGTAGANALFLYAKYLQGEDVQLDCHFPHSVDIVARILRHEFTVPPDLCITGIAPGAQLLKRQREYLPVMILPSITQQVVSPRSCRPQALDTGRFLFVAESPSAASFWFDELERAKLVSRRRVVLEHREPDEAAALLAQRDEELRAILWFPFYNFNEQFNGCQLLPVPGQAASSRATLLFARRELAQDPRRRDHLLATLRNAWLELRDGGEALDTITDLIVENREYLHILKRCGGLHHLM